MKNKQIKTTTHTHKTNKNSNTRMLDPVYFETTTNLNLVAINNYLASAVTSTDSYFNPS